MLFDLTHSRWHKQLAAASMEVAETATALEHHVALTEQQNGRIQFRHAPCIYAHEHVAHRWLVDPIAGTLEVLDLKSGRWVLAATHAGGEIVRAQPFEAIDLDLAVLWEEPAPDPAPGR